MVAVRVVLALTFAFAIACGAQEKKDDKGVPAGQWKALFDGKTLTNWKTTEYGGQAEAKVKDGQLIIPMGETLSGVTWSGDAKALPTVNYEIALEAQRVDGSEFFVGLTFPYKKTHATLVLGGWGGAVCGISSIGGEDAAHNSTATVVSFKNKQWYRVRLRLLPEKIVVLLDDAQLIEVETTDQEIDTRIDIDLSKPLGLATYQTTAALRDIKMRELPVDRPAEAADKK